MVAMLRKGAARGPSSRRRWIMISSRDVAYVLFNIHLYYHKKGMHGSASLRTPEPQIRHSGAWSTHYCVSLRHIRTSLKPYGSRAGPRPRLSLRMVAILLRRWGKSERLSCDHLDVVRVYYPQGCGRRAIPLQRPRRISAGQESAINRTTNITKSTRYIFLESSGFNGDDRLLDDVGHT